LFALWKNLYFGCLQKSPHLIYFHKHNPYQYPAHIYLDSIKKLRYLQSNKIKSVLGNHEDKLIRYLNHQKINKQNPIVLNDDEKVTLLSFLLN
jgi:hypothetical protein